MKYLVICLLLWAMQTPGWSQSLTLEACRQRARENYPLIKQHDLIVQSRDYTLANVRSGHLPQVTIRAQATYQSDVTSVPLSVPGFEIDPVSKDQYKVYADITQTLYDGGTVSRQGRVQKFASQVEEQQLEVELYKINDRVNQLFLGVLLLDAQLRQVALVQKEINNNLTTINAAIQNGTSLESNAWALQAERYKTEQRKIELTTLRAAWLEMLGAFINAPVTESLQLVEPEAVLTDQQPEINRPELALFKTQNQLLEAKYTLSGSLDLPKVGLFLQAGYGQPALNLLENQFDPYYLGGIRFSWGLSGFYNQKRDQQLLSINQQKIDAQRETFLFNTRLAVTQQEKELAKLRDLIRIDDKIIALRTEIKNVAQAQLDNGLITSTDFLRELNAEDQAVQNKIQHEIQLLTAIYNYRYVSGN